MTRALRYVYVSKKVEFTHHHDMSCRKSIDTKRNAEKMWMVMRMYILHVRKWNYLINLLSVNTNSTSSAGMLPHMDGTAVEAHPSSDDREKWARGCCCCRRFCYCSRMVTRATSRNITCWTIICSRNVTKQMFKSIRRVLALNCWLNWFIMNKNNWEEIAKELWKKKQQQNI